MRNAVTCLLILLHVVLPAQTNSGLVFVNDSVYNRFGLAVAPFHVGRIPERADLSGMLPPPGFQGNQNSCVGWALGYTSRTYYNLRKKYNTGTYKLSATSNSEVFSPAFIYNMLNGGSNDGINLYKAIRLMIDTGVCTLKTMPYQEYNWRVLPGEKEIKEARKFRIDTFKRVELDYPVVNLKASLIARHPVVCAVKFDDVYFRYGNNCRSPYYLWDTLHTVKQAMGHAIVLVGFNDSLQSFKFVNSFGAGWGTQGYGWISYKLIPQVIREAYIIKPRNEVRKPHRKPENKIAAPPVLPVANYFRWEEIYTQAQYKRVQQQLLSLRTDTNTGVMIENIRIRTDTNFAADLIIMNGYAAIRNIPCDKYKIVLQFFYKDSFDRRVPVLSCDTTYQLANGQVAAACKTEYLQFDNTDWDMWQATIPVSAFMLPKGKKGPVFYEPQPTRLMVEPVLFADDFPLLIGVPFEFEVRY